MPRDCSTHLGDKADNLVTHDLGIRDLTPLASRVVDIRMADARVLNLDPNV